jgi:hypothetical protein
MAVTKDTEWRHLGRVPYEIWRKRILDAGGTPAVAEREVWEAAGDDSALMLEFLREESSYASDYDAIPESKRNPWNLQVAGVGLTFGDYVAAAHAWRDRLYSPIYKQGIYAKTTTIADLISVYAPKSDGNDTDGYIKGVVNGINKNGFAVDVPSTPEEPMPPPGTIKPQYTVAPVEKQRDGQGFNYGTRGPVVGLVIHETQGRGTGQWYHDFFSCPNGERCEDALVDWLIDRDGMLWEYQDPYNTNRIPWASGGPENNGNPIGKAINAKYRNVFGGVNKVYAAVEMVKTDSEALTPAQIQAGGKLLAYVMAMRGYPANDWEYPDVLGGTINTAPHHSDISQTSCRISDSDKAAMKQVCTRVLSAYYQGTSPGENPTPEPPKPVEEIIPGVDFGIAKRAFDNPDLPGYVLTKGGKLSELYLARVKQTGQLPQLTDRWAYDDGRVYYRFSDGTTALFNDKDKSIRWIEGAA